MYMSAHVYLNLLDVLGKSDKIRGLMSITQLLFCNEFSKGVLASVPTHGFSLNFA